MKYSESTVRPLEEYEVLDTLIYQAAEKTDTAVLVIGRNSGGEECDRHLTEDYYLTETEEKLVKEVCTHFANVAVVLNVNGLIDLSWIGKYASIKSLIFYGDPWGRRGCRTGGNTDRTGEPFGENGSDRSGAL